MKIFTALMMSLMFIQTCNNDNSSNNDHELEGTWNMATYFAFMPPPMPTFNGDDVEWDFDFDNNELEVTYNISTSQVYILPAGTYDLSETNQGILEVDGQEFEYHLDQGTLSVKRYFGGDVIADLPEATFVKQ